MVAARVPRYFTPEEYLTIERKAEFKSEYLCGEIYAMAGGSPSHGEIGANVIRELSYELKTSPCHTFTSDVKVRTDVAGLYSYPDVSIVCGEPQFHDENNDVLTNPKLIVEVLSRDTEAYDRGKKFDMYQHLESLTDYLLVSQDEPVVTHYTKQDNGTWLRAVHEGMAAVVDIQSIGCKLSLAEVYLKIEFPKTKPAIWSDPRHGMSKLDR